MLNRTRSATKLGLTSLLKRRFLNSHVLFELLRIISQAYENSYISVKSVHVNSGINKQFASSDRSIAGSLRVPPQIKRTHFKKYAF